MNILEQTKKKKKKHKKAKIKRKNYFKIWILCLIVILFMDNMKLYNLNKIIK